MKIHVTSIGYKVAISANTTVHVAHVNNGR